MTNLEELTHSGITAKNNGTVEQLNEVLEHCFPTAKANASGSMAYYEASSTQKGCWVGFNIREPAGPMGTVIDITQLWEELQALKKPEIWWIRVTEENKETLEKWRGEGYILKVGLLVGLCKDKDKNRITKESNPVYLPKTNCKFCKERNGK